MICCNHNCNEGRNCPHRQPKKVTTYHCTECLQPCEISIQDEGIGAYDYHGAKGVDTHLVTYSECCQVRAEKGDPPCNLD